MTAARRIRAILAFVLLVGVPATAMTAEDLARETVPVEENADTAKITEMILDGLRKDQALHPGNLVRRDAHAKAHGCVKATFQVIPPRKPGLRQGLFARAASYPAWIRFSNGGPGNRPDTEPDGRGMAIKVMGVSGEKILAGDESRTQDFVMIHHDVFFVRNAHDYLSFQSNPILFGLRHPFHEGRLMWAVTRKKITNPFESRYWSMTPYALGVGSDGAPQAMKYSAAPVSCDGVAVAPITAEGPNFLREAMIKTMAKRDVCFKFMIQPQLDANATPIEDPTISWDAAGAPFETVAYVRIPRAGNDGRLGADNRARREFCEDLSMSPWHALPALRPLGGINRVRRIVYDTVSRFRHTMNDRKLVEPDGNEPW